jgi:probable rRNA maturation factor
MVQPDLLDGLDIGDDGEVLLGDIVLADGVCHAEAEERNVPLTTHATHLIVHGTLHLLGYDHIDDAEAEAMEAIEREALASLGITDPYAVDEA